MSQLADAKALVDFQIDQLANLRYGGLAQLARAPALQAGGHRFDSDILHGNWSHEY